MTDQPTEIWDLLAERLDAFATAWAEGDSPPEIRDYLPDVDPEARRLALAELVKIDLEHRLASPETRRTIEAYVDEFPELITESGPPVDLIHEEFQLRRRNGETVSTAEYLKRFPECAASLRGLIDIASPQVSTAAFSSVADADAPPRLEPGASVDDFDLLVKLGEGAFASVFLARQRSMQRLVAVKISSDHGTEPQTMARLDHPNIVRVYDQRILPDHGVRLLYMQYVNGGTLQDIVRGIGEVPLEQRTGQLVLDILDRKLEDRGESPPSGSPARATLARSRWPEVICRLGAQLGRALDYAHARGVLHRDVKPANVLINAEATPKLGDFNISFAGEVEGTTAADQFGGSLVYMSPEQLEAFHPQLPVEPEDLDEQADVYSLGVVLWELLYGVRPFSETDLPPRGNGMLDVLLERRRQEPQLPEPEVARQVDPPELREVLLRAMEPARERRWKSGGELAEQLQLCLKPRTLQLLRRSRTGWRAWIKQMPIVCILFLALLPNIPTAVFNFMFNDEAIKRQFPDAYPTFMGIQMTINGIAFPVGLALITYLIWNSAQAVKRSRRGPPLAELPDSEATTIRWRMLRIGHYVSLIGLSLWVLAGIAYPVSLHLLKGGIPLPMYPQFILSLCICGLVAAAYPFLFITYAVLESYYPALLSGGRLEPADRGELMKITRRAGIYLLLAGGVPTLAITLLVVLGLRADDRLLLASVSCAGFLGLGVAFVMYRRLAADASALLAPDASSAAVQIEDSSEFL